MAQYDWNSLTKGSLYQTLRFFKQDDPPKRSTAKETLIAEARAFLIENPDKIDKFFRKIGEVKTEKEAKKVSEDDADEGA